MLNSAFRRGSVDRWQRGSWRLGANNVRTKRRATACLGGHPIGGIRPPAAPPGIRRVWQRFVCYRPYPEIVLANARSMRRSVSNLHRLATLLIGGRSRLEGPALPIHAHTLSAQSGGNSTQTFSGSTKADSGQTLSWRPHPYRSRQHRGPHDQAADPPRSARVVDQC